MALKTSSSLKTSILKLCLAAWGDSLTKKEEKIGAGNAISCNDITFPEPKTPNAEAENRKRLLLLLLLQGRTRLK